MSEVNVKNLLSALAKAKSPVEIIDICRSADFDYRYYRQEILDLLLALSERQFIEESESRRAYRITPLGDKFLARLTRENVVQFRSRK